MRVIFAGIGICLWYFVFQFFFGKMWSKGLKVKVYCDKEFSYVGEQLNLIQEIENKKWLPLVAIKVKYTTPNFWKFEGEEKGTSTDQYYRYDLFSINGYERIRRSYPFICTRRGYYVLCGVDVFVSDFFYTNEYVIREKQGQKIYVFANRVNTPSVDFYFRQMMGNLQSKRKLYEDPFSFAGVRDYQTFDSMRSINWKATARTGQIKVNCLECTAEPHVDILLYFEQKNVEWDQKQEEYAISLAVTYAERFLKEGIKVSVKSNGIDKESGKSIEIAGGASIQHLRTLDEDMARIDLDQRKQGWENADSFLDRGIQGEGLHLVITTSYAPVVQEKLREKLEEHKSVYWLLPHYRGERPGILPELEKNVMELYSDEVL